jgi:hypothetical protein
MDITKVIAERLGQCVLFFLVQPNLKELAGCKGAFIGEELA